MGILRDLRHQANLTQRELGDLMGSHWRTIWAHETGRNSIPLEAAAKYSKVLGGKLRRSSNNILLMLAHEAGKDTT